MKPILIGVSLLALMAPAAYAQTGTMAPSVQSEAGRFQVFFGFDSATLDAQGRQIVAQAAEEYRRGGQTQVTVTGHTDTSGSAAYNLELSQRRAEAVAAEMIRQGVPATEIETIGRGEEDLLVPTADGVREPRNRRVEIEVPRPPPPAPPPAVAAEPPPPPPVERAPVAVTEREERPSRFTFTLGPMYGHNLHEHVVKNPGQVMERGETAEGGARENPAFPPFLHLAAASIRPCCTCVPGVFDQVR